MCTNARRQGCCKARVLSSGSRAGELHPARHKCPLLRCVPCAPQQDAAGALKKCELALCVSSPLSGSATHKSDRCGIIRALRAQAHKQRWHDSKARRRFSTQRYAQSACCRADIWIELHSNLPARGQSGRWYERHDPPGGGDEEQCYDWPCSHPPATRVRRSPTAEIKFWVPCHVPRGRLEQKQAAERKGWRRKDVRGAVALVCTIGFSRARMRCART